MLQYGGGIDLQKSLRRPKSELKACGLAGSRWAFRFPMGQQQSLQCPGVQSYQCSLRVASSPLNKYILVTASSFETSWTACHLHVCLFTIFTHFLSPCCHLYAVAFPPFLSASHYFWQIAQKGSVFFSCVRKSFLVQCWSVL